ncbi:MAG: hypothetical protein Ct9H300mP21_03450 [Pseudomonadota bacterium]|nr:MAG: hypothetical protein Ct9H300mP21_03450 [Pseudomonadota bacterium]
MKSWSASGILAQIQEGLMMKFFKDWLDASDEQELKEILLRDKRFYLRFAKYTFFSIHWAFIERYKYPRRLPGSPYSQKRETIVPRGLTVYWKVTG